MDLVNIIIVAVVCIVLGVLGGFAARSLLAGIFLGVFVFVGWFLWRMFKTQEEKKEPEQTKDNTKA
jgi:heme/copper-type cytochrome/quinol oxidase subunit 2